MKKFMVYLTLIVTILVAFAFNPKLASAYNDYGGYSGAFHGTDADNWVLETGGSLTFKSGSSLILNSGSSLLLNGTVGSLSLTYGINAATGVFSGALAAATLNTGQGAYELYKMDQNVDTTASPTFSGASLTYGLSAATVAASGDVSVGGNLDLTGNAVVGGAFSIDSDSTYSAVEVSTEISPVGVSFLVVSATGTLTSEATPFISTTTAVDGQFLTIIGGSANVLTISDNDSAAGTLLELGAASRAIGEGDIIRFVYYNGKWREISFSDL